MATNDVQNSLFAAIDTIIGRRIEQLELDKTVVASIEQCVNSLNRQYRVQYQGGSILAYAQSDETYAPNTSVYVSIPQNDLSAKKWILGRVSEINKDYTVTEINKSLENFQLIGQNLISTKKNTEFSLSSYTHEDGKQVGVIELYNRTRPNNLINIDQSKMLTYMSTTDAILLEASFRTNLDAEQRRSKGDYGLAFTFMFESADNAYKTYKAKLNSLAPKIIFTSNDTTISLQALDNKVQYLISLGQDYYILTVENKNMIKDTLKKILADLDVLIGQYKESELELGLLTQYKQVLTDMLSGLNANDSQWFSHYNTWLAASPKTLLPKEVTYSLYSDKMIGNPYLFLTSEKQYDIFDIDTKHFKYIDSVVFYCYDFNLPDDLAAKPKSSDIFVKDIKLQCLQELSAVNGDYKLKMKFPQGQIFELDSTDGTKKLTIEAEFLEKTNVLTKGVKHYWFVKDGKVTNSNHENYNTRGGVGWRYFDKADNENSLLIGAKNNTAYENVYKCVTVYEDTITLKTEFTIFNEANPRIIEIESDLGTEFKFDNGEPVLTCKILDDTISGNVPISIPSVHNGYSYSYIWMRRQQNGQSTAYEKTYDELVRAYNEASMNLKLALKTQLSEMEGILINKNSLQYPVQKIKANEFVTFDCYVYRTKNGEEEFLGTGSITLKNTLNGMPSEYHIVIENGDQVFQYTDAGVSPCSNRVQDPVKVKDLICHFYDPNGLEVNSDLYNVTWKYPTSNTLIVPPENLLVNPANGLIQLYKEQSASFAIKDTYDCTCLDNQITCVVEYNDIKVDKTTGLYFGKMGDNGTNGTDIVAKVEPIDPTNRLQNEPLTLISVGQSNYTWNSGTRIGNPVLQLKIFNKNELLDESDYKNIGWKIAGKTSNLFEAASDSVAAHLGVITASGNGDKSNYIIRGQADVYASTEDAVAERERQTVYASYPICSIDYTTSAHKQNHSFFIDKERLLKQILYNANGRNPMYNENQGVFFSFSDNPGNYVVSWTAKGGSNDAENKPAFDMFYVKDGVSTTPTSFIENAPFVYIKPKDIYGGECQNNHVEAKVQIRSGQTLVHVATVKIPLYMSLNLYSLSSLNAWDGNTIEINEEGNYIMAPQIGAGKKDKHNAFTGIVMGIAGEPNSENEQVGLLGYHEGKQSIFLDAETGNATFGLPNSDDEGREGRIELRPGSLSSIASWKFNSSALFNIPDANANNTQDYNLWGGLTNAYADLPEGYKKSIPHDKSGILLSSTPSYISVKGKQLGIEDDIDFTSGKALVKPGDTFELEINPNLSSLFTIYRHTCGPHNEKMYVVEGAQETYITERQIESEGTDDIVKYSIWDKDKEAWYLNKSATTNKNTEFFVAKKEDIAENESIWVVKGISADRVSQGDYISLDEIDNYSTWRRIQKVGIDNQGRFYTDAVKSNGSGLVVSSVGAFGQTADVGFYTGAFFEVGSDTNKTLPLIKMFCEAGEANNPTTPLFVSGGNNDNEYARPMHLYGEHLRLYANDKTSSSKTSGHTLKLDGNHALFGHESMVSGDGISLSYLSLYSNAPKGKYSKLRSEKSFVNYIGTDIEKGWPFESTLPENKSHLCNFVNGGSLINRVTGDYCVELLGNVEIDNEGCWGLYLGTDSILLGDKDNFKATTNKDNWLKNETVVNWGGKLFNKIDTGTKFERDSQATILATSNRLGIYSQNGMDITSLGDKGLAITADNILLKANSGIVAQGYINCNDTVTAINFNFGENKQAVNSSVGANENLVSADIWEHIDNLYRLVKQASDK